MSNKETAVWIAIIVACVVSGVALGYCIQKQNKECYAADKIRICKER